MGLCPWFCDEARAGLKAGDAWLRTAEELQGGPYKPRFRAAWEILGAFLWGKG